MEKLKIGDSLYNKENSRWSDFTRYKFATVERLTKTQAILSNGDKVINDPKLIGYSTKIIGYEIYGDRWNAYHFVTPEIKLEAEKERKRIKIYKWFNDKKFTDQEKEQIFNLLYKEETK